MKYKFTEGFDKYACEGEFITAKLSRGRIAKATIVYDQDSGPPWDSGDGYGIVSDWRDKDTKRPGERVLCAEESPGGNPRVRFYDLQETMKKAREEDWGCGIESHSHKTPGERADCAVEQDFQFHRAWCEDKWFYCGIVLSIEDKEGEELDVRAGSLWGIECNSGYDYECGNPYLLTVANDLLSEYKTK
jgi:hypothetical protein